ncbi:MAG: hypothetical protein KDH96_06815 [Candidatus Riesia sp.]|nr:hypothetical protein [Candidatus Riesia sp.]
MTTAKRIIDRITSIEYLTNVGCCSGFNIYCRAIEEDPEFLNLCNELKSDSGFEKFMVELENLSRLSRSVFDSNYLNRYSDAFSFILLATLRSRPHSYVEVAFKCHLENCFYIKRMHMLALVADGALL